GHDRVEVVRSPRADVLVLGDELLPAGPPRDGRVRDALGPLLPAWLRALGADVERLVRVRDTAEALRAEMGGSTADLVVTTGGTAGGPVDHVHAVLDDLGATYLVDGVAVRPGHPQLLARRTDGRLVVGLPGNPLAAVSGVLTLVMPVVQGLRGERPPVPATAPLTEEATGHPRDTRLVPVLGGTPLHYAGPAMLRGLAAADGMAVIPPGGAGKGDLVEVLALPW
ncbi:MAG: molybdopterin-binding protein, partial [Streptomycetales bacterium]